MSPVELAEYIRVLRDSDTPHARFPVDGGECELWLAETARAAPVAVAPATPFVDANGQPINLDEGNPWADEIGHANFPGADKVD